MKFKEIFKKIKTKKYCLTALLLAGLLVFAVLGGLNGSKSSKNQAYAATAPAVKNLDLNGVRYTYQTSLKELKSNYNIFNSYSYNSFSIFEDGEGILEMSVHNIQKSGSYTDSELTDVKNTLSEAISIQYDNIYLESLITSNMDNQTNKDVATTIFEFSNAPTQSEITGIKIDYKKLYDIPYVYLYENRAPSISVMYVKKGLTSNDNIYDNSIIYCYIQTNSYKITEETIYYNFNKIDDYYVKAIWGNFEVMSPTEFNGNNQLYFFYPTEFEKTNFFNSFFYCGLVINDLNFSNINNNMLSFNVEYQPNKSESAEIFKGNILLSKNKRDTNLVNDLISTGSEPVQVNLGKAYFGGKFNDSKPVEQFFYKSLPGQIGVPGVRYVAAVTDINSVYAYNSMFLSAGIGKNFWKYNNQNQLLYLEYINDLYSSTGKYKALSAQVEDILYNVNYVGNIEEIEFNEKVEEDFTNLIKTAGLGGFLGLLLGLLFGVPGLGAGIGALIGLGFGIVPLIIDGLQAIFGKDFLGGLYNFFKSITEFFANFVDTVINFLMSIITNPFVLVFIVIAAIIFLIFYFNNK